MSQAHPRNRSEWLEPPDDADPVHEWGHLNCPNCGDVPLYSADTTCPTCKLFVDESNCDCYEVVCDCDCVDEPWERDDGE